MMMSVLWYYKPEQMRAKCADIIKCEEVRSSFLDVDTYYIEIQINKFYK